MTLLAWQLRLVVNKLLLPLLSLRQLKNTGNSDLPYIVQNVKDSNLNYKIFSAWFKFSFSAPIVYLSLVVVAFKSQMYQYFNFT